MRIARGEEMKNTVCELPRIGMRGFYVALTIGFITFWLPSLSPSSGTSEAVKTNKTTPDLVKQVNGSLSRWRQKNGIVIVALGDSITAGVGLDNPDEDCYAELFARMLARWLAPTRVKLIRHGIPGMTADVAAREINFVLSYSPDMVLIQFGGNDSRLRRPLDSVKADLIRMIEALRRGNNDTAIILIVPPFQTVRPNSPMAEAIRSLAKEINVTMADFDRALHEHEHDFRGWFSPPPSHPGEYSHVIMAKELWRAFHQLVGVERALDVQIGTGVTWLENDATVELPIAITNLSQKLLGVELIVEHASVWHHWAMTLDGNSNTACRVKLRPPITRSLKFLRERISAVARSNDVLGWDVKWATWTPVIYCDDSAMWVGDERIDGWLEFANYEHITLGGQRWRGPNDLSFKMRLRRSGDGKLLKLVIDVKDDVVVVKPAWDFSCLLLGDCVEVFFDHRQPQRQGKPFFDEDVTMLAVVPGSNVVRVASWSFDEVEPTFVKPSGRWTGLKVVTDFTASGYCVELTIPLSIFGDLPAASFDVLIDDTDERSGRSKQMSAFGWANDFRNPSPFALLLLERAKKMLRWRLVIN